jgi:hypothetical protein
MLRRATQAGEVRVDDFRAIDSIALREQIVSDPESGRKFLKFIALFDYYALLRKRAALLSAP